MNNKGLKEQRESGIELLRLIAMFLIVIFHVFLSVSNGGNECSELPEYTARFFDANLATTKSYVLWIDFFRHFGALGNDIFFICSFWFLCGSNNFKLKKIVTMIMDVWCISVCNVQFI